MRHAKFHSRDHLIALIDSLADSGFLGFDVTGGEPTLHPDICEAIAHATKRGLSSRIITLGQYLTRHMKSAPAHDTLLDGLLAAGLTNFLFSYHASDPDLFRQITGESLDRLTAAMNILDERGFHYTTNTTVYEGNFRHLPDLARSLTRRNTYLHNFIVMNAYYQWGKPGQADKVQAHYGEIAPYLREAVEILEDASIACNIRYAPHCVMAGLEKNLVGITSVRFDPYEWMNRINHYGGEPVEMGGRIGLAEGEQSPGAELFGVKGSNKKGVEVVAARGSAPNVAKLFPKQCENCSASGVCDGVDPRYLGERGSDEFVPYIGDDRGFVIDKARKAYTAPFFVKRRPDADMKSVIRRAMKPAPVAPRPDVSAVVTCHNYGKYLGRCLDSLLAQTWKGLEVIVVDDGSTDNTKDVLARYADRLSVIIHRAENFGQPSGPRNEGIACSTGELVFCLDADDWVEPSYVEECASVFLRHPEAAIVWTGTQCWQEDGATRADMFRAGAYDFNELLHACTVVCSAMFRREVWAATGGYRHNVRGSEDWDHWVHAGSLGYFGVNLPRQLFNYRRHPDGLFESDVVPNFQAKVRQVVLNNADAYPPNVVALAREGKEIPADWMAR